jgi:Fe-S-cluster-containing dehydrogenase component/formate-dependent nitrite reductase membrane component NrfD
VEHGDPLGVNKTWVKYIEKGQFPNTNRNFSVTRCNHCADSPCTDVCPVTALWEREDGIVDFDPERCIGCKACMQACPYDALYIDPETETAAKCNYCSHRVDSGREPACVTVCPEDAIVPGDLDNPDSELSGLVASEEVQVRKPEKGTDPDLYYVDGDEASITPAETDRKEHYMWSDAPHHVETHGPAREDFDLAEAARSLAASDVDLDAPSDGDTGSSSEDARADGGPTTGDRTLPGVPAAGRSGSTDDPSGGSHGGYHEHAGGHRDHDHGKGQGHSHDDGGGTDDGCACGGNCACKDGTGGGSRASESRTTGDDRTTETAGIRSPTADPDGRSTDESGGRTARGTDESDGGSTSTATSNANSTANSKANANSNWLSDADVGDDPRSDGGYATEAAGDADVDRDRLERAYELLQSEARRVYDVGEDHYRSWGWEVYAYTWTKSLAAGLFLVPALLSILGVASPGATTLAASAIAGGVFLGATGVLLVLDLEQPTRFHWVLLRPNWKSWLVKGAYIISAYGALLGLYVLAWLAGVEGLTGVGVLLVGSVLAAGTAVYTAFLFAQAKGRDLWQSPAMPLHMFVQAIVAGAGGVLLLGATGVAGFGDLVGPAGATLLAGLLAHAALVGSEFITPHGTEDAELAAHRIVRGEFSRAFWAGGVALGLVVPIGALAVGGTAAAALAGASALAGLFAYEYCWITAPQTVSLA